MDRNICEDGTPAIDSNCGVAWISDFDYECEGLYCAENDKGLLQQ